MEGRPVSVTVRDDGDGSATDAGSYPFSERFVIQINGMQPDDRARARLDYVALRMQQIPPLNAVITGHTDDRGDEELNLQVGRLRAAAVRDYLVRRHNIEAGRIETKKCRGGPADG